MFKQVCTCTAGFKLGRLQAAHYCAPLYLHFARRLSWLCVKRHHDFGQQMRHEALLLHGCIHNKSRSRNLQPVSHACKLC